MPSGSEQGHRSPREAVSQRFERFRQQQIASLQEALAMLKAERDRIDGMIRQTELQLDLVTQHKGEELFTITRVPNKTPTGRLTRKEAAQRREESGLRIYEHLVKHKGQGFTRAQLEGLVDPLIRYQFGRIVESWNCNHPHQKISDNHGPTASRRYKINTT